MIGFLIGLFVGGILGVAIMCILFVSRQNNYFDEKTENVININSKEMK